MVRRATPSERDFMRYIAYFLSFISLFVSNKIHGSEEAVFDAALHRQALSYHSELGESYYCWKIPNEAFIEFLDVYRNRPIQTNYYGMRSHGNFFLWYFLKKINPALVIESGVYRGQSTWMIEQAAPDAKIIAIDPDVSSRIYHSSRATYTTTDFSQLQLDENVKGPIVCFFDDHIGFVAQFPASGIAA